MRSRTGADSTEETGEVNLLRPAGCLLHQLMGATVTKSANLNGLNLTPDALDLIGGSFAVIEPGVFITLVRGLCVQGRTLLH